MRHSKSTAALALGALLGLAGCGGGGSEANNSAMNALESGFGNAADPSAVETMGNGSEAIADDANLIGNDALGNSAAPGGNATGATSNGI